MKDRALLLPRGASAEVIRRQPLVLQPLGAAQPPAAPGAHGRVRGEVTPQQLCSWPGVFPHEYCSYQVCRSPPSYT